MVVRRMALVFGVLWAMALPAAAQETADGVIDEAWDEGLSERDERLVEDRDTETDETGPIAGADLRRIIDHERAGNLHSPFLDDEQRLSYRDAVERELDEDQIERLRDGDADVLKDRIEDRLDRLYAAKTYLQSDAVTANCGATRAVVEEIAEREYQLHRADLVDGESERGETH